MDNKLFLKIHNEVRGYVEDHRVELSSLSEGMLDVVYKGNLTSYGLCWIAVNTGIEGNIFHFLDSEYNKMISIDCAQ